MVERSSLGASSLPSAYAGSAFNEPVAKGPVEKNLNFTMVISSILMEAMLHFVSKFQIKFQVFLKDSFSLSLKGVDLMQRRYIQIQNNNNNKQLFLYVFKQRGSEPGSKTCSWGYPTPRVPLLQPSLLSSHENPHCSCLRTQCRVRQITHTLAVAFPLCQGRCSVGLREPLLPTAH